MDSPDTDTTGKAPPEQAPRRPEGPEAPASVPLSPEAGIRQKILLLLDQAGIAGLAKLPKACANRVAMLAAVESDSNAFILASAELKDDKEIVLAAVRQNGMLLAVASETLRNDKDVVTAAVTQNDSALQFASKELCDDLDVATAAVKQGREAFQFVSDRLRNDKQFVLFCLNLGCFDYGYRSDESLLLASDKDIVMALITKAMPIHMLWGLSKPLRDDEDIVLAVIEKDNMISVGSSFEYASDRIRAIRKIALAAISSDIDAFDCVADKLKCDMEFLLEAARVNPEIYTNQNFIKALASAGRR